MSQQIPFNSCLSVKHICCCGVLRHVDLDLDSLCPCPFNHFTSGDKLSIHDMATKKHRD